MVSCPTCTKNLEWYLMHTTSIFDLKVSFQRQFEGKPVSLGTEKFLPYHTFILLTYTYSTKPVPKMHKGALNRSEIVQVAPCICNATEVFMNSYL